MPYDKLIAGGTVVLEDGHHEVDVAVAGGKVAALLPRGHGESAAETIDASGLLVLPGLIDPHTHIGLGGEDDWRTESRSAVRGGVTTVVNYVMGSASYFEQVQVEHEHAQRLSCIDYALHVVPCAQVHLEELHRYADELGVTSFKFFMSFRGTEGAYLGIEGTDDGFLYEYLRLVGERPGAVANVHPENIEVVWRLRDEAKASGLEGLAAWDASRPDFVEAEAISRAAFYADLLGAPLYVVHVSAERCIHEIHAARAKSKGTPLYVETCPHYLTHTVDSPIGSRAKVNPPVRHAHDVEALWQALADGTIQTVGSDHAGRHFSFKDKDIWSASAGMPGIASILGVLLSEGHHKRGLPLEKIVSLTSAKPARIFGLGPRKGTLAPGADADLVLVDLDAERTVDDDTWESGSGYTIYNGWTLKGWPTLTMRRGDVLFRDGEVDAEPGTGEYLAALMPDLRAVPSAPLVVAAGQARCAALDVAANAAAAADLVLLAADEGADVLVLPELFLTGYELEAIAGDPATHALARGRQAGRAGRRLRRTRAPPSSSARPSATARPGACTSPPSSSAATAASPPGTTSSTSTRPSAPPASAPAPAAAPSRSTAGASGSPSAGTRAIPSTRARPPSTAATPTWSARCSPAAAAPASWRRSCPRGRSTTPASSSSPTTRAERPVRRLRRERGLGPRGRPAGGGGPRRPRRRYREPRPRSAGGCPRRRPRAGRPAH